ncbi:MAG: undecaprenyl/decaprenyl-phosphate alpha-N-acetylglucosaminyl 1-phosphate transferase [Bacteroidetes bacterium]|nr:undecaprenyl/decaprenyl-phosphate alpha-N-acetylglucosaminyl 1-phosphate transferase [Bacteroidota bacterium]
MFFLTCFITSFLVAFASIPTIIRIASRLQLFDEPNERKLHIKRTPLLGGVAVFAAMIFSFTLGAAPYFEKQHLFIITSLILIFFFGLRDDIAPLAPLKKLSGQITAALILILFCNIRLTSLHGLFGIHILNEYASFGITLVGILFIVNSYNLIDGIDGLASGLGIIASFVFSILFYVYSEPLMSILALSLCGALLGFFPYNFRNARIFLGDTGTMTIGFVLSIFSFHFIELTRTIQVNSWFDYQSAPTVVFAILVIPMVDTLRVFTIRIFKMQSPFIADRNHIHHRLLELGFQPHHACLLLYLVNTLFILSAWFLRHENPSFVLYSLVATALIFTQLPLLFLRLKKPRQII